MANVESAPINNESLAEAKSALGLLLVDLGLGRSRCNDNAIVSYYDQDLYPSSKGFNDGGFIYLNTNASLQTKLHELMHSEAYFRKNNRPRESGYIVQPTIFVNFALGLNEGITNIATARALSLIGEAPKDEDSNRYDKLYEPVLNAVIAGIALNTNKDKKNVEDEILRGYFNSDFRYLMENVYNIWGRRGIQALILLGSPKNFNSMDRELAEGILSFFTNTDEKSREENLLNLIKRNITPPTRIALNELVNQFENEIKIIKGEIPVERVEGLRRRTRAGKVVENIGMGVTGVSVIISFIDSRAANLIALLGGGLLYVGRSNQIIPYHDRFIDINTSSEDENKS